jgi:hypothetical protein
MTGIEKIEENKLTVITVLKVVALEDVLLQVIISVE